MDYLVISPSDPNYPPSLRPILAGAPLYAIGNLDLLRKPSIGICGSRNATKSALRWAYEFGREAGQHGIVVVSGYARGVDRRAHKGALEGEGGTVAVLPAGIRYFRLVEDMKPLADFGKNFLAVSMFEPDARWTVWRAMERNKLIVALSVGLFVIEARERGGTIDAAYKCMEQGKLLWAIAYAKDLPGREGNRKLLATSAIPLRRMRDLKHALEKATSQPPTEVKQLVMNLAGQSDA